ncbi:glycosyltransferase [Micromonospora sp. NBC_01813]|uniref:glycosyltransferase n=1 Tax=Micromonospora sp. NBC_01813 TaxID=2975988 RepID=UPI002DD8C878|nr:glycosyltransferase [Micromonospora sp. NBC_01813]WSA10757.1 glycosyltransferase [Micromonospora sp. NBC_01813]
MRASVRFDRPIHTSMTAVCDTLRIDVDDTIAIGGPDRKGACMTSLTSAGAQLSVIVPTYNRSEALRQTLKHLARQRMPTELFEVIVTDDGSSDDNPRRGAGGGENVANQLPLPVGRGLPGRCRT